MSIITNDNAKIRVSTVDSVDSIPNLFADFDIHRQIGFTDGNLVTTLTDWKNGNNLTQSNSGRRLKYKYNQTNGYSAIQKYVGGTDGYYGINSNLESAWFGDITFVLNCYLPSESSIRHIMSSGSFGSNSKGFELLYGGANILYRELDNYETFSKLIPFSPDMWNTIVVNIKRGGNSYISVNGVRLLIKTNTNSYLPAVSSNLFLGTNPLSSVGVASAFAGTRLLIYKRALSEQEEAQIRRLVRFTYNN